VRRSHHPRAPNTLAIINEGRTELDDAMVGLRRCPLASLLLIVLAGSGCDRVKIGRYPINTILPTGIKTGERLPLVIYFHGLGGSPTRAMAAWQPIAARARAIVVIPEAVDRLPLGDVYWKDLEETDELALKIVEWARSRYSLDDRQIVTAGNSEGASYAMAIGSRHPDTFAGIVSISGGSGPDILPKAGTGMRVVLLCGTVDSLFSLNEGAAEELQTRGLAFEFRKYPGVGHAYPPDATKELTSSLDFVLKRTK
jgi:phospholipase/carboxylesterase